MTQHIHSTLSSSFGIQHGDDAFWYRPLILGNQIFTYVAHIPPGGGVPPYPDTAEKLQIEHSLYLLAGSLRVTVRGASATLVPHTAIRIPPGDPVEMKNEGDTTATIYMAYTPSPWGPMSPIEDRRGVTNLEEMRAWYHERGRRIWSPAEMDAMAGDLTARPGSVGQLDRTFKSSREGTPSPDETLWATLWDADGYRHGHEPGAPDDFWFRPFVSGSKHISYVGLIPPGGGVPPSPEEAAHVEMSVYSLGGELGCIVLDPDGQETRFVVPPHHAVYAPLNVAVGFFNDAEATASFSLTFGPAGRPRPNLPGFRQWATEVAGWPVVPPPFLNEMLGETLWDLESQ